MEGDPQASRTLEPPVVLRGRFHERKEKWTDVGGHTGRKEASDENEKSQKGVSKI
jgi:hypothetical protein